MKVDKKSLKIVEDEEYDDISLEDLVEGNNRCDMRPLEKLVYWTFCLELPDNAPRFIILSYEV